jgi:hypothetical protein
MERIVGEAETLTPFMDSALAEQDGLSAGGERVADHLPFLESDGHREIEIGDWKLIIRIKIS